MLETVLPANRVRLKGDRCGEDWLTGRTIEGSVNPVTSLDEGDEERGVLITEQMLKEEQKWSGIVWGWTSAALLLILHL